MKYYVLGDPIEYPGHPLLIAYVIINHFETLDAARPVVLDPANELGSQRCIRLALSMLEQAIERGGDEEAIDILIDDANDWWQSEALNVDPDVRDRAQALADTATPLFRKRVDRFFSFLQRQAEFEALVEECQTILLPAYWEKRRAWKELLDLKRSRLRQLKEEVGLEEYYRIYPKQLDRLPYLKALMTQIEAARAEMTAAWKPCEASLDRQVAMQKENWRIADELADEEYRLVNQKHRSARRMTPEERRMKAVMRIEKLQKRLERVNQMIEKTDAEAERWSGKNTNPAADMGGIRSRSPRQKRQLWERRDRIASDSVKLRRERFELASKIAYWQRIVDRVNQSKG